MEKVVNLNHKLVMIQNELKAPKSQYNSFGKYHYRNAEDILEAAKPLCLKHNVVLTLVDDIVLIGERFYVKATAQLKDIDSPEVETSIAFAREEENKKGMDGSQVTGASSSYARKYALNGLFCIDDTKDADSQDNTKQEIKPTKQVNKTKETVDANVLITKEQIAEIKELFTNERIEKMLVYSKCEKIEDMTSELAKKYMSIEKKKNE